MNKKETISSLAIRVDDIVRDIAALNRQAWEIKKKSDYTKAVRGTICAGVCVLVVAFMLVCTVLYWLSE